MQNGIAADLPEKLEQVSFCDLTPDQRSVYQQIIEASRKQVLEAVGAQGVAKSRMVVLTALLRLRQICCDLRLLKLRKTNDENAEVGETDLTVQHFKDPIQPSASSGKMDLFDELLEEVID